MARLPDGEDWLFRPVLAGLCSYADAAHDTRFSLVDFARMNEMLDVQEENTGRIREAMARKDGR